jgi:hypothetical protein
MALDAGPLLTNAENVTVAAIEKVVPALADACIPAVKAAAVRNLRCDAKHGVRRACGRG